MNRCPKCREELPVSASFCGKCGLSLHNKTWSAEEGLGVHLSGQSPTLTMPNNLISKPSMVVKMNEQKQSTRNKQPGFWILLSIVICLIVGLGAYIASTYLYNPISGTTGVSSGSVQPTLSLQEPLSATIKQGQTLTLHGEQFRADDPISFLLDFALPIKDKNNQNISLRASSKGSFDVSIPIQGSDWSVNTHSIQGVDNLTKQDAYLTVMVSPASVPVTRSHNLALSMEGETVTGLTFRAVAGQGNPDQQRVTFTNISHAPLDWTVTANADQNLSWLVIDPNHLSGNLGIGDTDSIGIGALITALKANIHYNGQVVFTINGQEQLILPVALQVVDSQSEMIFTPNPAVAILGPGNTCQATTFTLINVGNAFINWTLVPYDAAKNHIQFIANGRSITQGLLASSGTPGDTQVLNLQCNGVLVGNSYQFTMYAGNTSEIVTITVQA